MTNHQMYGEWSAAYVLGALDALERVEFETHLAACDKCQREVASFAPVPGLLGRLDSAEVLTAPDRIANRAADKARSGWDRIVISRRRWRWTAAAAAVAAVLALVGPIIGGGDTGTVTALALDATTTTSGEIAVQTRPWGTAVDIELTNLPDHERYVAWAVSNDGQWEQIASWGPTSNHSASVSAASSIPTDDLASVVITSANRADTIVTANTTDA